MQESKGIDRRSRLVSVLLSLNDSGKIRWSRNAVNPEFIHCFVEGDLIRFELSQGQKTFDPTEAVHGIVCVIRNCHLLWLEDQCGWSKLLRLLQSVPIDSANYSRMLSDTEESAIADLEQIASEGAG